MRKWYVIDADRKSMRYRATRELGEKLHELANQRPLFGYRRLLHRKGVMINRKHIQRLYKVEGVADRRRLRCRHESSCSGARLTESTPEPGLCIRLASVGQRVPAAKLKGWRCSHTRYDRCARTFMSPSA